MTNKTIEKALNSYSFSNNKQYLSHKPSGKPTAICSCSDQNTWFSGD